MVMQGGVSDSPHQGSNPPEIGFNPLDLSHPQADRLKHPGPGASPV